MKLDMLRVLLCGLFLMGIVAGTVQSEEAADAGFVSMFNGEDLEGWDGRPGSWRVEDGAIIGECGGDDDPCATHYLFWTVAEPGDFIMRFEYKLSGEGSNSGVQIRSERRGDYDVWGYQADFDESGQWNGCLFQHDRGGVVMRGYRALINEDGSREEYQFADPDALLEGIRDEDWNSYEIVAVGPYIQLKINDVLMTEVIDRDEDMSREDGVIGLQLHMGPPMQVHFRDLKIKILD